MIVDVDPAWRPWLVEPIPDARCHEGWRSLVIEAISAFGVVMARGARLEILAIKEKFGGLRIYIRAVGTDGTQNERLLEIGSAAQRRSLGICEVCGQPGAIAEVRGWFATRCPDHAPDGAGVFGRVETGTAQYKLARWRIIKVDGGEHHLVGFAVIGSEGYAKGRVSSPVRAFDPEVMVVTTRSGNRYELVGSKGRDVDADWVLEHWLWWNSARVVDDDCGVEVLRSFKGSL